MKVIFSELANLELQDIEEYYNLQLEGLGKKFKDEVKNSISKIIKYPTAWSLEKKDIRKFLMYKYPYNILYSIEKDHIFIIAIAHQHRKPEYWVSRKNKI